MYEMTIKGASTQELYAKSVELTVLLARGGMAVFPPAEGMPSQTETGPSPGINNTQGSAEPRADAIPVPGSSDLEQPAAAVKPKRGRPPAAPKTIDAVAEPPKSEIPDFLQNTAAGETKPATHTVEDVRGQLRAINKVHGERLKETGIAATDAMNACVAYIGKLLGEFGVGKASDLAPEKYAEFMTRSAAYLEGAA